MKDIILFFSISLSLLMVGSLKEKTPVELKKNKHPQSRLILTSN